MICRNCYSENPDDALYCVKCGQSVQAQETADAAESNAAEETQANDTQPAEAQPVDGNGYSQPTAQVPSAKKDGRGFAVASFVLSLVSFVCCCGNWVGIICAILALIFGGLGLNSSRRGMAIAGLIIGSVAFAIGAAFIVFEILNPTFFTNIFEEMVDGFKSGYTGGYDFRS